MRLGSHCRIELAVRLGLAGLNRDEVARQTFFDGEASLSFSSTWRRTSLSERFTGAFAVRR